MGSILGKGGNVKKLKLEKYTGELGVGCECPIFSKKLYVRLFPNPELVMKDWVKYNKRKSMPAHKWLEHCLFRIGQFKNRFHNDSFIQVVTYNYWVNRYNKTLAELDLL